jgi:hypothetical protein
VSNEVAAVAAAKLPVLGWSVCMHASVSAVKNKLEQNNVINEVAAVAAHVSSLYALEQTMRTL